MMKDWRGWCLAGLFFLLPFERIGSFVVGGHTFRLIQFLGLVTIILYVLQQIKRRQIPSINWLFWPLLAFIAATFITTLRAATPRFWENYLSMIFLAVLLYVVAQLVRSQRESLRFIRCGLFAGALAASIFGVWQFVGDSLGVSTRWTGLRPQYSHIVFGVARIQSVSTEPLYYANYLLIPIVFGVILYLHKDLRIKRWEIFTVILCLANFILTLSRGAYLVLGLALALVLLGLMLSRQMVWRRFGIALGIGVLVSLLLLVGSAEVAGRHDHSQQSGFAFVKNFFTTSQILKSVSYTDRQNRIFLARRAWRHAPVFGLGLGRATNDAGADYSSALINLPKRYGYDQVATFNYYWELLAESGIVGFVLMVGFVLGTIIRGKFAWWQARAPEQKAWLLATVFTLLAIFIQAYTFTGFYLTYIWIELGLLIGLIMRGQTLKSTKKALT